MARLADSVNRIRQSPRSDPDGRMTLVEHIRELRNRLLKVALAIVAGMGVGLFFFTPIWNLIQHPFCSAVINGHTGCRVLGDTLIINGVFDSFMLRIKVAFFAGLIITSPVWFYQLWAFIAPGLYRREKRWTYAFVATAAPLFAAGAVIAYFAMSRGLRYLLGLAPHGVVVLPSVDTYLGYFVGMLFGFGLCFELPLALLLLNMAGILTHERIKKWRRMMIFGVFLFAGIASPSPDPLTMLLLAAPCLVLVEVAEVIIWANDRRRANRPSMYESLADDELAPLDDHMDAGDRT
jgi:sec-independent protein translocase protein TatC